MSPYDSQVDTLSPAPLNVTLFGSRVFADEVAWEEDGPYADMTLTEGETWTQRWTCTQREGHEKRETQIGAWVHRPRNARDAGKAPESGERPGPVFSLRTVGGNQDS